MLRALRIAVLLFVLATVAQWTWLDRRRVVDWNDTLRVVVYPIDGDGSPVTAAYLGGLDGADLAPVDDFMAAEAARYGLALGRPTETRLGPRVAALPPSPPQRPSAFEAIVWSLHMRWWAWRHDDYPGPRPHVRVFVVYHDPARSPRLAHSVGLAKGMIGLVRAFASARQDGSNNVVVAHELMHLFGATDKYDPATGLPRHPDGYAEPDREPLHPQRYAEIMGGRIPLRPGRAEIPRDLGEARVGNLTAAEIGWSR